LGNSVFLKKKNLGNSEELCQSPCAHGDKNLLIKNRAKENKRGEQNKRKILSFKLIAYCTHVVKKVKTI
jgi:hypothetical protein